MHFKQFLEPAKVIVANMIVTFLQAAGSFWLAAGGGFDKLTLAGAAGAGFSAVYNLVIKPYSKKLWAERLQPWLMRQGLIEG